MIPHVQGRQILHTQRRECDKHRFLHRVLNTFRVKVPKGAQNGQRLRLSGKGGQGVNGGRNGDLYVVMALAPHPVYRVSGADSYVDLPLAPWGATLGARGEVPTPGGPVEPTVPLGTGAGRRLRLAKRGLPTSHESAGDLFALVRIEVPKVVQGRERELFAELAATSTFNPRA
jgi:curved DNA-binding protein